MTRQGAYGPHAGGTRRTRFGANVPRPSPGGGGGVLRRPAARRSCVSRRQTEHRVSNLDRWQLAVKPSVWCCGMAAFETDNVGVVVVTHGTPPPSRALDSLCFHDNLLDIPKTPNGFILLVKQATALIRALINEGKRVHVIASGGKRQW